MPAPHPRTPAEIPVTLDRAAESSLPVQIAAALRDAIDREALRPGESVAATRQFAQRLGVARGVVVAAYEQLIAEGYLSAEHGRGTMVNPDLIGRRTAPGQGERSPRGNAAAGEPHAGRAAAHPGSRGGRSDPRSDPYDERPAPRPPLKPGAPVTDTVDRPAWRAAWRSALIRADRPAPPLGDPGLRAEIAEHLRLVRGTARPAADVLVTAGAREGLGLLLSALGTTHGRRLVVGVEDPGYPSLRGVAARHGARIVGLPVDDDGLRVDRLPNGLLDLVIVTPSHQYPVGGSLPLPRRRELLEWASRTGVVIVEDDYDSELRSTGSPLPALAALDDPVSGPVVTLGTFSSTVTPALAAGFLLAPERLRGVLEPVRRDLGSPVSTVVQLALAEFLRSGELRRNIARMRRRYAARRDLLSERFAGLSGARPRPMNGGLHAVIELTGAPDAVLRRESEIVRQAARPAPEFPEGLGVAALGAYWRHERPDRTAGLVLGMGGPEDAVFSGAIERLWDVLQRNAG
ncbi:PLP-dependent aminotransferase family protein [Leucobacter sp. gxy201]|uniref:MocR-like pyridoxine biosynthesis transcription factor PdxR n=1 Tax=Leucobacter sp. gxy201 TaxID=2957200 RepID=UPI003D9FDDED